MTPESILSKYHWAISVPYERYLRRSYRHRIRVLWFGLVTLGTSEVV